MQSSPEANDLLFPREYVADTAYADRAASAFFRFTTLRPGRILPPLLAIAVFSVAAFLLNLPWYILTFGGLIGWGLGLFIGFRSMRGRLRASAGTGGTYAIGFRPDAVVLTTPSAHTENDYRSYEELIARDEFVYLRARSSRSYSVLPAALFTPESLQWTRDHMAAL